VLFIFLKVLCCHSLCFILGFGFLQLRAFRGPHGEPFGVQELLALLFVIIGLHTISKQSRRQIPLPHDQPDPQLPRHSERNLAVPLQESPPLYILLQLRES